MSYASIFFLVVSFALSIKAYVTLLRVRETRERAERLLEQITEDVE